MEALRAAWDAAGADSNFYPSLVLLNKKQLEQIAAVKNLGVSHVRVVSRGPGERICPECQKMNGVVFPLDSEMRKPHLPNKNCVCTPYADRQLGFCLCYYEVVFDDEVPLEICT